MKGRRCRVQGSGGPCTVAILHYHEFTDMYPAFLEVCKKEGATEAVQTFYYANEVEKVHGAMYQKAIDSMRGGKDIPVTDYFVCPRCGYTAEGAPPDTCPVCGAKKEQFGKI